MAVQKVRAEAFSKRLRRIVVFRRAGGIASAYMLTAGTPMAMYGVDVAGVADSRLMDLRRAAAKATAPPAGGKNPDLVLYVGACAGRDADPAHAAHVLPIGMLAETAWELYV